MGDYQTLVDSSLLGVNRSLVKLLEETEKNLSKERKTAASLQADLGQLRLKIQRLEDDREAVDGKEKLLVGMLEEEKEANLKWQEQLKDVREKLAALEQEHQRVLDSKDKSEQAARENKERMEASMKEMQAQIDELRTALNAAQENAKRQAEEEEESSQLEVEKNSLIKQLEQEKRVLEEREAKLREELRQEGKASLQALQSMRQRIGQLRGDRRALEEKERELEIEREVRLELEAEMEAMRERMVELEDEVRGMRERMTSGEGAEGQGQESVAGANKEVEVYKGMISDLEADWQAVEARAKLLEEERDAFREQLVREREALRLEVAAIKRGSSTQDQVKEELELEKTERERLESELSVLKVGLKVRLTQLEDERRVRMETEAIMKEMQMEMEQLRRQAEDKERQLIQKELQLKWAQRISSPKSSSGETSPKSVKDEKIVKDEKQKEPEKPVEVAMPVAPLPAATKTKAASLPAVPVSTEPPPKPNKKDKKLKKAQSIPHPVIPAVRRSWTAWTSRSSSPQSESDAAASSRHSVQSSPDLNSPKPVDDQRWHSASSERRTNSEDSMPRLTEEELDLLEEEEEEDWDSDVEADLQLEFEAAKAKAWQCIKSGTLDSHGRPMLK